MRSRQTTGSKKTYSSQSFGFLGAVNSRLPPLFSLVSDEDCFLKTQSQKIPSAHEKKWESNLVANSYLSVHSSGLWCQDRFFFFTAPNRVWAWIVNIKRVQYFMIPLCWKSRKKKQTGERQPLDVGYFYSSKHGILSAQWGFHYIFFPHSILCFLVQNTEQMLVLRVCFWAAVPFDRASVRSTLWNLACGLAFWTNHLVLVFRGLCC